MREFCCVFWGVFFLSVFLCRRVSVALGPCVCGCVGGV